jgi:predicted DNA-binding protein
MNTRKKRQSVSLPVQVAQRVHRLAKTQRKSTNRVIVELIESGLDAREAEKQHFLALADRLASTEDERERERIKKELAKLTFGE